MDADADVLAADATAGQTCDFDAIFTAHFARVARVIARVVRDRGRAEDLAVDAFLKWWRHADPRGDRTIGWLYRDDYARGGFPMLAVTDRDGASTGRQAVLYATALLPVTLAAGLLASAGAGYLWGGLVLGLGFLACAAAFAWKRTVGSARRLFLASVLYLPLLLGLMVFDR